MKTRIIDIARLAQVSPGTVDRVLHNRGEVSEKTRNKVKDIIEELNYEPDILARTLATKKSLQFLLLIPVSANENDFWNAPLTGVDKALNEISHYGIRISKYFFNHFNVDSFNDQAAKVLGENPDGVIFAPVFEQESQAFVKKLNKLGIPVVLINSRLESPVEASFIGQDSMQSGYLAGKLLTYGLKEEGEILVVNISARSKNYNHILKREIGFRKFFAANKNLKYSITTVESMHSTHEDLFNKMDKAFENNKIIGVFVSNSRVYQIAQYFKEKNKPKIRLIGYDLIPENVAYLKEDRIDFLISQRPEEQGYMGVISLFNKVFLGKELDNEQYIPIDLITKENLDYYKFR